MVSKVVSEEVGAEVGSEVDAKVVSEVGAEVGSDKHNGGHSRCSRFRMSTLRALRPGRRRRIALEFQSYKFHTYCCTLLNNELLRMCR